MKISDTIHVHRNTGFSTVEFLIVVSILLVFTGIALPGFVDYLPKHRATGAARQLFTDLQKIKMRAISENNDYVMTFDTGNNSYSIYDDDDNDFSTVGAETAELIQTVNLQQTYDGVAFGFVSGQNDPDGAAITASVSFTGTPPSIVFRPTGLANQSGGVFVKPTADTARKDRQRAVLVKATGHIRLYKHSGTSWD